MNNYWLDRKHLENNIAIDFEWIESALRADLLEFEGLTMQELRDLYGKLITTEPEGNV